MATLLIVCLSIGILAIAGILQAAESDKGIQEGKKAISKGAKQLVDENKMVMDIMAKKGIKDPDLMAPECSSVLETCAIGEKKVKAGAGDWYIYGTGF